MIKNNEYNIQEDDTGPAEGETDEAGGGGFTGSFIDWLGAAWNTAVAIFGPTPKDPADSSTKPQSQPTPTQVDYGADLAACLGLVLPSTSGSPPTPEANNNCISCPPADFFYPSLQHNVDVKDHYLHIGRINQNYFDSYGPYPGGTNFGPGNDNYFAIGATTEETPNSSSSPDKNESFILGDPADPLATANLAGLNSDNFPRQKKLYVKSGAEDDFVFGDPFNYLDPRAILSLPNQIYVNNPSALGSDHSQNPKSKLVPLIASEDYTILSRLTSGTFIGNANLAKHLPPFKRTYHGQGTPFDFRPYRDVFAKLFSTIYVLYKTSANETLTKNKRRSVDDPTLTDPIGQAIMPSKMSPEQKIEASLWNSRNINIAHKAAMPHFAAVPVVSNQLVYGPWTNYPIKEKKQIFPYLNDAQQNIAIENMICNTKVKVDTDLNPWTFNGVYMLDNYVDKIISEDLSYQLSLETGQITIPGLPAFSLGDEFRLGGSTLLNSDVYYSRAGGGGALGINKSGRTAPLAFSSNVTSMSVQLSNGKGETTYTLRTYTSRLSLYNKENADRFKKLAEESRKVKREASKFTNMMYHRNRKLTEQNFNNTLRDLLYRHEMRKTSSSSPTEVLVGSFNHYANFVTNKLSAEDGSAAQGGSGPTGILSMHRSRVGLYEPKEMNRELDTGYATKSFMSLDGIFSPVSFYPTPFTSTKHYIKYDRRFCPFCNGTKVYTKDALTTQNSEATKYYCDYCEDRSGSKRSPSIRENLPPFILASGIKLAVRDPINQSAEVMVYEYVTDKALIQNPKKFLDEFGKKTVNLFNLNPIIVATGEFRNSNASSGDMSGHSIDIIGRGYIPPKNSLRITENIANSEIMSNNSTNANKKLKKYDPQAGAFINDISFTGDYIAKDFCNLDYEFHRHLKNVINLQNPKYELLNQRFFSLRGPLVLHAWGFDTEGYPVPNASGEPHPDYIDAEGRPLRTKNLNTFGSTDPQNGDCGSILIGKNQVWNAAKATWSTPYKETSFAKEWGQQPNLWPVGPIDLRWDEDRSVWTVPQPYKNVYVTLEEDMVLERNTKTTYPARGFIDSTEVSKDPLPSGLRRVVFVKDYAGYTAPRGAKLYCKYNSETGFYDPVGKPNIIASGVLQQGNTATIYNSYAVPNNGIVQQVAKITTKFANNLGIEIKPNHKALFIYMEGSWNLMSIGGQ